MTAQLFLAQVASDYRRVASLELDLREVEQRRNSDQGAAALERAGVVSRPVAPLAVAQYLASFEHAPDADLRVCSRDGCLAQGMQISVRNTRRRSAMSSVP
jgi:hypothetical protein